MGEITDRRNNRKARRSFQHSFKEQVKIAIKTKNWGEWQEIKNVATHPDAPKGIEKFYQNDFCSAQIYLEQTSWGKLVKVGVRVNDASARISWSDLQRIKNELIGEERTAIQVFPKESELVDDANMYWLWVLPEGFELPFKLT